MAKFWKKNVQPLKHQPAPLMHFPHPAFYKSIFNCLEADLLEDYSLLFGSFQTRSWLCDWLAVTFRIDFEVLLLVYKSFNGLGPQYIRYAH